jgi:hypothetical protein
MVLHHLEVHGWKPPAGFVNDLSGTSPELVHWTNGVTLGKEKEGTWVLYTGSREVGNVPRNLVQGIRNVLMEAHRLATSGQKAS